MVVVEGERGREAQRASDLSALVTAILFAQ
jgi:hypothetical protein